MRFNAAGFSMVAGTEACGVPRHTTLMTLPDDGGVQHGGRLAVVAFNKDRIPTWFFNSSEADMAFTFVRVGDEVTRGKVAGELPDQHEAAFGDLRACRIGHRPEWSDDEGAE